MKRDDWNKFSTLAALIPGLILLLICFGKINGKNSSIPDTLLQNYLQQADSLMKSENYEDAIVILNTALELAIENNLQQQQAIIYNKTGKCLSMANQDEASIDYFRKAVKTASVINDNELLGKAFNNLGVAYEYTGQTDSAIFFLEKALVIREQTGDTEGMAESYRNIAQVLRVLNLYDEARKYCRKAFELIPQITNYRIIANIYNETGYLFELENNLDSAKIMYQKLIDISRDNNFYRGISIGYTNLAYVYEQEEKYSDALALKKEGLSIDKKLNNTYSIMASYKAIADCYLKIQEYSNALSYLDSAALFCDPEWVNDTYEIELRKYKASKGISDFENALSHFEMAALLKDSLFSERKQNIITEILTKYETEKKEQQIAQLDKVNRIKSQQVKIFRLIIAVLFIIAVTGGIIAWLIIKNRNHRIRQMSLELKNYVLHLKDFHISHLNEHVNSEIIVKKLMDDFELTQREAEVMDLLARGCHNNEIAGKLYVSDNTIKYHIKNIYIKLDVKSRVQALQKTMLTF
jgi:tetratricopeptide (TPR) repeat protein